MKKRVHEIAKANGLTSKEVIAALKKAGIEVTAAASSVEEDVARKALAGGDGSHATQPRPSAKTAPAKQPAAKPAGTATKAPAKEPAKGAAEAKPVRPVRAEGGATASTSGQKKRRRVVIDSQASRRDDMRQAPPPRPPRRRGGRRRRPLLEEPVEKPQVEEVQPEALKIPS